MEDFEALLCRCRSGVERWVKFKVPGAEADDVLQEIWLAAYAAFPQLRDPEAFRPWLLGIARRKCADWYRRQARRREIPVDSLPERPSQEPEDLPILEALEDLPERDRLMLRLFYQEALPQRQIAARLGIPEGTVKSRLHTARERLRVLCPSQTKGEKNVKTLPAFLPPYTLQWKSDPPFPVVWEEMMGWFIVPRMGETLTWGMYDLPSRKLDVAYDMAVTGPARVHGIDGVSIRARLIRPGQPLPDGDLMAQPVEASGASSEEWTFVAQLADGHTRFLSAERTENGMRTLTTFLDGDEFLESWGFGEDNRGCPIHQAPRGIIRRAGSEVQVKPGHEKAAMDVVGRCQVTLDGVRHDTVCLMDLDTYQEGQVSEQYLDARGRTVLWRRFNSDDWRLEQYGRRWSELLPDNERITVNGRPFVHWYDCLCIRPSVFAEKVPVPKGEKAAR